MSGKRPVQIYHIRVEGQLDEGWNTWFPDLIITAQPDGTTNLCGAIEDQSVLHGILARARDLNLNLLSVESAPGAAGISDCIICRALRHQSGRQTQELYDGDK